MSARGLAGGLAELPGPSGTAISLAKQPVDTSTHQVQTDLISPRHSRLSTDSASSAELLLDVNILPKGQRNNWKTGWKSNKYFLRVWRCLLGNIPSRALSKASMLIQNVCRTVTLSQHPPSHRRHIYVDPDQRGDLTDTSTRYPYVSNTIRSSRYTIWNFLPHQLVAQFCKTANFYFMIVAILQAIPKLSTTGNFTTFIPLSIFVSISMAKEAFDDFRRYRLDRKENNRRISVLRPGGDTRFTSGWKKINWSEIKVGDIISLDRDEAVPADILLLNVQSSAGAAHIETMALDGETWLKYKQPCPLIAETCNSLESILTTKMHVTVQHPDPELHKFDGNVVIGLGQAPLTINHIVYRGSILRNTPRVIGLVIYTGEECKIRMNANKSPRSKAPLLQIKVNRVIFLVVCLVTLLTLACTLAYTLGFSYVEDSFWYLHKAKVALGPEFISFFIMFNTMIPLSLYTSMEIVKVAQVFLLHDVDMYDEDSNTPLQAHTSTVNEDLGQVRYILSDKTGTLTENLMQLRRISVAGRAYFHDITNIDIAAKTTSSGSNSKPTLDLYRTKDLLEYAQQYPFAQLSQQTKLLMLHISLCHTCIPENATLRDGITFQGISPDEVALLTAAKELGYILVDSTPGSLTIQADYGGHRDATFEVLDIIDFSTARKRMSIIVRMPDGRICLFCKGADSVVRVLLRQGPLLDASETMTETGSDTSFVRGVICYPDHPGLHNCNTSKNGTNTFTNHVDTQHTSDFHPEKQGIIYSGTEVSKRCFQHLEEFALDGLRTFLHAHRFISEETYRQWKRRYTRAQLNANDQPDELEKISQELENQLELTGVTAIEDKLQKGVPEAIDKLQRANIKIWMLTGDKRETAVSIGHSCGLLESTSALIHFHDANFPDAIAQTKEAFHRQEKLLNIAIVIDGSAITAMRMDKEAVDEFFSLATQATTLICSRASPKEKAFIVSQIRKYSHNATTLAIGDGANDIAMIQEADIGIGITGKEGLEAARMSDYSIAQFRFLVKLLLVHGRWNYIRICKYTLGTFWKEVVFYTTQALYQRWNGYTGTSLYEPWGLSMYNTLFTSVSVVLLGIFTKDLSASTLLAFPELYQTGQRNQCFSIPIYLGWTAMAFIEACMIFFVMHSVYASANAIAVNDIFSLDLLAFSACVIVVNVKLQFLEVYNKSLISMISLLTSIGGLFVWNIVLSYVYRFESGKGIYHVRWNFVRETGQSILFWLALVLAVSSVVLFEVVVTALRVWLFPTDVDRFQEYEREFEAHGGEKGMEIRNE